MVVNPNTIEAQVQGGIIFGITAALYSQITIKDGRVEQNNFTDYRMLRIDRRNRRARHGSARAGADERDLRGHRQAAAPVAGRQPTANRLTDRSPT
jgi:hypothetical protein